jgi:hypothetical protein
MALKTIEELRLSKVVVVLASETSYWKIALAAHAAGMLIGWAWIGLDTVDTAEYAPTDKWAEVNVALSGWIYFQPLPTAGRDFFDRVQNATRSDFPTLFDETVVPSPYAASLYDAVILFATVANEHAWLPDQGGSAFLNKAIGNVSFEGSSGLSKLDASGDLEISLDVLNMVLDSDKVAKGISVGEFKARTHSYSSNRVPVIWPGGVLEMPRDMAPGFETWWLLVGAAATSLVVVSLLVVLARRKRRHLEAILVMLLTEAGQMVFGVCMAIANLVTDVIVFDLLLRGRLKVSSEIYLAAYATILCFAVVITVLSMGYRLRNALLVRTQLEQLGLQGQAVSSKEAHRQAQQHRWELSQTHRTKVTLSLALLSVALQGAPLTACFCVRSQRTMHRVCADLPMSVMNICVIFVEDSADKMVRSLARWWCVPCIRA